jgi:hypothetical protein
VRIPRFARSLPLALLVLLVALWLSLGLWICFAAPFGSGTDESIRYVAFAAATNRWASEQDAQQFGIDHYYYPPLCFLMFAPFFGDEPSFTTRYPLGLANYNHPLRFSGSKQILRTESLRDIPAPLLRLYRTAKVVSLLFGLGVVACVAATIRLLFAGPEHDWLVFGATAPLLLLPQFLDYQTLVNNDALVNFLCALALALFVAAARAAAVRDARRARLLSVGCAAAAGLGLLTKQSAAVLLPLLPALAWLQARAAMPAHTPAKDRLLPAARHLALLGAATFAAGGWWLLRGLLHGDVGGLGAARLTHSWAVRADTLTPSFLGYLVDRVARSYIALFAGEFYGIPDWIYLLYLLLAAAFAVALVAGPGIRLVRSRSSAQTPSQPEPLARLVWGAIATVLALNALLIVVFNLGFVSPYGRLLFPSLVATHALLALGLRAIAGSSSRRLVLVTAVPALWLAALFLWTFDEEIVRAVQQPDKTVVPLSAVPKNEVIATIWDATMRQIMVLPPGRLVGFRIALARSSRLPQFGARLRGSLSLVGGAGGGSREVAIKPVSIGDQGGFDRWVDLALETPVELRGSARGWLSLRGTKPWLAIPG